MSVHVELLVPVEDFVLTITLQNPGVDVTLESSVPVGRGALPSVRVHGIPPERVVRKLSSDPDIENVRVTGTDGTDTLVRVKWKSLEEIALLKAICESDAALIEGCSDRNVWNFQLRFADTSAVSRDFIENVAQQICLSV